MEQSGIIRNLELFAIPSPKAFGNVEAVRKALARLVAAESLSLGELQTARDIVGRAGLTAAEAYLFIAAMFLSLRGGNTFLRPSKGVVLLQKGGYLENEKEGDVPNHDFAKSVDGFWNDAVAAMDPIREETSGDVIENQRDGKGDRWFFRRNLDAIDSVSKGLSALLTSDGAASPLSPRELEAAIGFNGFKLADEQVAAVKAAAEKRFVVVTGGPGTGKTTVVCSILRALIARGLDPADIALTAPTGRAAQRLGESLLKECAAAKDLDPDLREQIESLAGTTIHSLLGGFPPNWKYTAANRLPNKLVVVDESSMVDVHLMKALVAALPDDCRLILIGDKNQLPSVDAGAVLGDIVADNRKDCIVTLSVSQRNRGDLAASATALNNCDSKAFGSVSPELHSADSRWLDAMEGKENSCFRFLLWENEKASFCHDRVVEWAEHFGLMNGGKLVALASDPALETDAALTRGVNTEKAQALFDELKRSRILAVVRKGPFGVNGINELLSMKRFGGRKPSNPFDKPGVPVIVTRNTPNHTCGALFNGDVGVTVKVKSGMVVLFPRGKKVVCCPVGLLPEHELAYAITVHKSQGSEFDNVLVVLPADENHPLLNQQLVYTGITRARIRAVILGKREALAKAFHPDPPRDTGITLTHGA